MIRGFPLALLPALLLGLSGCAVVDTGIYHSARPLPKGAVRIGGGASSGLHLEEVSYSKAGRVSDGEKPLYVRSLFPENSLLALYLTTLGFHSGYGLHERLEVNLGAWGGLLGLGGRGGFKYNLFRSDGGWHVSLLPSGVYMKTEGGSSPGDEATDGQQMFLQYIINNKEVYGVDLPLAVGMPVGRTHELYLVPSYSVYRVDVSKAYQPDMAGEYLAHRYGLAIGFALRPGQVGSRQGYLTPEISLSVIDFPGNPSPAVNVNFALGFGVELRR